MKKLLLLSLVCLAGAAALMLTTLNRSDAIPSAGEARRVALLAADETGTFYMQLKQGAGDAAENLNAVLSVEIMDENGLPAQAQALAQDGIETAIVYAEDEALAAEAAAALGGAGVASVTLLCDAGDRAILSDAGADAQALADAALDAGCVRALVLGENPDLSAAFAAVWTGEILAVTDVDSAGVRPGDCAVALTGEATKAAMARAAGIPLFGVDTGETRAEDLETGKIDGLLLSRPYVVGYRAVEAALAGGTDAVFVSAKLVTPVTMYLPENVSIVYPLIQ